MVNLPVPNRSCLVFVTCLFPPSMTSVPPETHYFSSETVTRVDGDSFRSLVAQHGFHGDRRTGRFYGFEAPTSGFTQGVEARTHHNGHGHPPNTAGSGIDHKSRGLRLHSSGSRTAPSPKKVGQCLSKHLLSGYVDSKANCIARGRSRKRRDHRTYSANCAKFE